MIARDGRLQISELEHDPKLYPRRRGERLRAGENGCDQSAYQHEDDLSSQTPLKPVMDAAPAN